MKLQSYFFAFAIVVCMLKAHVVIAEPKKGINFDDLYPQTPFSISLSYCMRILGELENCEVPCSSHIYKHITDLMAQLTMHSAQIDVATILPEDAYYLEHLICHLAFSYQKLMESNPGFSKKNAWYYLALQNLIPMLQRPN